MDKTVQMLVFLNQLTGVGIVKQNRDYLPFLQQHPEKDELFEFVLSTEHKLSPAELKFAWDYATYVVDDLEKDPSVRTVTVFDELYPRHFLDLGNKKPVLLFAKGDLRALQYNTLGVIGTRSPSDRSANVERIMVSQAIGWINPAIVSGLALGCDYVAHRTTLDLNGCTIAILPCGFKHISPPSHKDLANEIVNSSGCLLSEYEPGLQADKYMFVRRDSLVAALSEKLLVVECGLNSGTMHAVKESAKLGRPIGCVDLPDLKFEGNEQILHEFNATSIVKHSDWGYFLAGSQSQE